jgi:hypothetical protein
MRFRWTSGTDDAIDAFLVEGLGGVGGRELLSLLLCAVNGVHFSISTECSASRTA